MFYGDKSYSFTVVKLSPQGAFVFVAMQIAPDKYLNQMEEERMKLPKLSKILSVLLVIAMLVGMLPVGVFAVSGSKGIAFVQTGNQAVSATLPLSEQMIAAAASRYESTDIVRISIVLEGDPAITAFSTSQIGDNDEAVAYRQRLLNNQNVLAERISRLALNGQELDVVWNLTLVANMISANVEFGQIEAIRSIPGVRSVVLETQYEATVMNGEEANTNSVTSSSMIGSSAAYLAGYTGAGTRIAVIDTGIDTNHQSFDAAAFAYSLEQLGGEYDLLDAEEIAQKLAQLHISEKYSAEDLYVSAKIPFGFNYVDENLNIDHDRDSAGDHGSHVTGIAAANAYIPDGNGGFVSAAQSVSVQGVAPDAQVLTMKVFGVNGGAYDSDYMAAIEDAIVLGADAVNLSLGSSTPGYSSIATEEYQEIFQNLENSDTVVAIAVGNYFGWSDFAKNMNGYLYADDVNMHTGGYPGTYTNSLGVASVNNDGVVGEYFAVGGQNIVYSQSEGYGNEPMSTLAGTWEYVLIDGVGDEFDFDAIAEVVYDRVVVCSRGTTTFADKANNAYYYGAIGLVVYNNQDGVFGMDLTGYEGTIPCVSIRQADGDLMRQQAQAYTDDYGNTYYIGTMEVAEGYGAQVYGSDFYTMSDFSSWGVPGSLELKPEITAPGGEIYSVNGTDASGSAYITYSGTSMACPQVAGMAALVAQYIKEQGLEDLTGLPIRTLSQSLLMSTATPLLDETSGSYWPVLQQGAGLANVGAVLEASSYILMNSDATDSWADGKVKVELGDDPDREGVYTFSFVIYNLSGETERYTLSASLFTQALFADLVNENGDVGYYMDKTTAALAANATWMVNGELVQPGAAADFDGDGDTDGDDCMALLSYIAGTRESITDLDKADYDGDGYVTSFDANLFLRDTGVEAAVPAYGATEIAVTLSLTAEQKAYLDAYYETGAYIEGYVFAETEGTCHSIPVLGFYGDWSDPSMYEVGSEIEYSTGSEVRAPYAGDPNANYVTVNYAALGGKSYYFGGNPIFSDEAYDPQRNAINSLTDSFDEFGFMLIRNAAAGRFLVMHGDEILYQEDLGQTQSAFYYVNGELWYNTANTLDIDWNMAGAIENEQYTLVLSMATEYHVDENGNVDWDALGEGATLAVPFTIDNTAPTLLSVEEENGQIVVTVNDNQYLAAVMLANSSGTEYAYAVNPEQTAAGETVSVTLDSSVLADDVYLLQVYDYAMNCTTYRIFYNVEMTDDVAAVEVAPNTLRMVPGGNAQLVANVLPVNVTNTEVTWSSSDETVATVDENGQVTALAVGSCQIIATSKLDGAVSGVCNVEVFTIDKELSGIVWSEDETVYWSTFNVSNPGDYTPMGEALTDVKPLAATYDEDGVLYGATMTDSGISTLYTFDPVTFAATEIGTGSDVFYGDLAQSPTLDALVAVYGPYLLIVDKETGDYVDYLDIYPEPLVGVAYCGSFYYPTYRRIMDSYLLIGASGNVYRQCLGLSDGYLTYTHNAETGLLFNCDIQVQVGYYFNSAYYDGNYLYWSVCDREANCSKLFAMDIFEEICYEMGAFPENVWPVGGLMEFGKVDPVEGLEELMSEQAEQLLASDNKDSLPILQTKAISGSSYSTAQWTSDDTEGAENTATVYVTAQDAMGNDIASSSGKIIVTYDAHALQLQQVTTYAQYAVYNDTQAGRLVIVYAGSEEIPAGTAAAKLTFRKLSDESQVTVRHEEADSALNGNFEEILTVGAEAEHSSLIHVEAKAPGCTENGNTEYWYCATCGKYYSDETCTTQITYADTIVEATGHALTQVEATAATCTETGCIAHQICEVCGQRFNADGNIVADYQVITKALGHVRLVKDVKEATETETGYTGDVYCGRCGETLETGRVIPVKSDLTLDEALNVEGGTLEFKTDDEYPWTVETDDYGVSYAISGNQEINDSESVIYTQVYLKKGQTLEFKWKASSETYSDYLWFYVNGMPVTGIYATYDELDDEWFGYDIEWKEYTYVATKDGVYTFSWGMVNDDNEWFDGSDLGYLDDVRIGQAEMATVTFEVEGQGSLNGKQTVTVEYPVGYYLTPAEIPEPAAAEGYTFLGWMIGDTTEVTTFKKVQVTGPATYRAVFAKQTEGYATIILETHNVFKDGSGYQMLLDSTHQAAKYFNSMNLVTNTDWESWSDYSLPNAHGNEITSQQIIDGSVAIQVPAGLYDWVVCYPYNGTDMYILTMYEEYFPSYVDDFEFVAGYTYHFEAYNAGSHDGLRLNILEGLEPADEVKEITIRFEAGEHGSLSGQTEFTAWATTALKSGVVPKAVADEGYVFKGWYPAFEPGTTIKEDQTYTAIFEEAGRPATIILEVHDIAAQATEVYIDYYMSMGLDEETAKMLVGNMDPYDYAMLFDVDANVLGDLISYFAGGWALDLAEPYEDISAEIMGAFEYVTPEGFDGSFTTDQMLRDGTVTIEIPAGTYDYVIANRITYYAGTAFATVTNFGQADGYAEDFVFESGKTYHFTVTFENAFVESYGMEMPSEIVSLEVYDTPCDHEKMTHVEAKDATCTENGNPEYWYCDDCDKYFSDAEGTAEIEDLTALVLPAQGHGETEIRGAKEATCTEDGYTGDTYCKSCGEQIGSGEVIPATGHHYGEDHNCTHCGEGDPDAPPTGDRSYIMLWLALTVSSGAVITMMIADRKKRKMI